MSKPKPRRCPGRKLPGAEVQTKVGSFSQLVEQIGKRRRRKAKAEPAQPIRYADPDAPIAKSRSNHERRRGDQGCRRSNEVLPIRKGRHRTSGDERMGVWEGFHKEESAGIMHRWAQNQWDTPSDP
jgi:hypothetical protein